MGKKIKSDPETGKEQPKVWGDPSYSEKDDIYSREKKEPLVDSDDSTETKRKAVKKPLTGEDLDVPGAELDDQDEEIGEEDEENNYYSIGGENHEDLEEDKGD